MESSWCPGSTVLSLGRSSGLISTRLLTETWVTLDDESTWNVSRPTGESNDTSPLDRASALILHLRMTFMCCVSRLGPLLQLSLGSGQSRRGHTNVPTLVRVETRASLELLVLLSI